MPLPRLVVRATAVATQTPTPMRLVAAAAPRSRIIAPPTTSPRPYSTTLPSVTDKGFWKSLVPKPLRRENRARRRSGWWSRGEWNPATYFIVMFLFVGSMSIQMIALRNQTTRYMRQASVRLQRLREVVERIQNGEDVDVEKMLGTGEPQREADWEEALQAIEREEAMRKSTPKEAARPKSQNAPQAAKAATPGQNSEQTSTKSTGFGNFY